ncbi:hypothetical protein ACXN5S_02645 [Pseudoroseicyclus sp. H15]
MTRVLTLLIALALGAAALAGLVVLSGRGDLLQPRGLQARVDIQTFPLPSGFGADPQLLSDYLLRELDDRASRDVALRVTLSSDGLEKLREVALPRLMSPAVTRGLMEQSGPLAEILSLADVRSVAEVQVTNRSGDALSDVAITLPGALIAEDGEGQPRELRQTAAGITALEFGTMAAGESAVARVWLDRAPGDAVPLDDAGSEVQGYVPLATGISLGSEGGAHGRVILTGGTDWPGVELESLPAVRWGIAGLLFLLLCGCLLAVVFSLRPSRAMRA